MKLSTAIDRLGPWLVFATLLAAATACVSIYLALRACEVSDAWAESCARLQEENARLRQELAVCHETKESLVITVNCQGESPKTLALKNRNYTNVKALPNDTWRGQIGTDRYGHAIFEAPAWSIRATALTLRAYEKKHGIRTIKALVERFSENNHAAYIKHLCHELRLQAEEEFSITSRLPELIRAMVKFESGESLGDELLAILETR